MTGFSGGVYPNPFQRSCMIGETKTYWSCSLENRIEYYEVVQSDD